MASKQQRASVQPLEWVGDYFAQFETSLNGQSELPLHQLRRAARDRNIATGIPSPRANEAWKYTPLRALASWKPVVAASAKRVTLESDYLVESPVARLWFENGSFSAEKSDLDSLPEGMTISRLSEVMANPGHPLYGEVFSRIERAGTRDDHEAFITDLNTSFLEDGVVISVAEGAQIEEAVQICWVAQGDESDDSAAHAMSFPYLFAIAEKGAKASVIETFYGAGRYLTVDVCHLIAREEAELCHVRVQAESKEAHHLSAVYTEAAENSRLQTAVINTGGSVVRNEVYPDIAGGQCMAELLGVSVLDSDQHCDNHTVIDHIVPEAESIELYKGVYDGKSKGVFNGTIIVRPDSQLTNAVQSNNSLLLSDTATSISRPQLKIWADDVKCTHGATIGQIDEDGLFYLRSRGIPEDRARAILIHAFAVEAVEGLASESLRLHVEALVHNKLNDLVKSAHVPNRV